MEAEFSVPHALLAYISQGQLHLERDGGGEILESPFGFLYETARYKYRTGTPGNCGAGVVSP